MIDDILMACDRCGNRVLTPRVAHDPVDAVRCHTSFCNLCETWKDECDFTVYYDKDGIEVEWWNDL